MDSFSFSSYESASLRRHNLCNSGRQQDSEGYNLYGINNLLPIIISGISLLGLLFSPYILIITSFAMYILSFGLSPPYESMFSLIPGFILLYCVVNISVYYFFLPISDINGIQGRNSVGASTEPGLYYSRSCGCVTSLLSKCPILRSKEVINGGLPSLSSTPWMLSGDMRTLFPFLSFNPPHISYIRRWIRVPLCDGSLDDLNHEDSTFIDNNLKDNNIFEAVALDCAYVDDSERSKSKNNKNNDYVLLILAGLTGGSNEGYVLDLVNDAHQKGNLPCV